MRTDDLTGEVAAAAKSDLSARCVSLDNLLLPREAEGAYRSQKSRIILAQSPVPVTAQDAVRQKVTIQYVGKEKRYGREVSCRHV